MAEAVSVVIDDDDQLESIDQDTGAQVVQKPDGAVVVDFADHRKKKEPDEDKWFANLADEIDPMKLAQIGHELADAIEADDRSRDGYLQTVAAGIDILGLKIERPGTSVGESTTAVEGQSKVTNPLLLDAILKGWATAQAELLPAIGPLKVMAKDGMSGAEDDLAETLENDFNYYLTTTAAEYYPDTSHMLLWGTYFGGSGFKKVYRCPMRRRPVSESVDPKDLIVSDATKDLRACERITHYIPMRPSILKRMQLIGAYRKVDLPQPVSHDSVVESKIEGIQGTHPEDRPEDRPYNLWESQCELDLDQFIPEKSQFKGEGIALPYVVTIDKDSKEILALRRDWNEHDEQCQRRRLYVKYPYVPGPGFYGTGMLQILGNASMAMTAAWREALDAGAYANFPGGLYSKLGTRQNSNLFRVSPGEWLPIETAGQAIGQTVMPLPYKDVTPGLLALIDKVTAQSKEVGGVAEVPAAEGLQNVPVGTMLAQIEQATKVMAAAHKGMHQAQSEEFALFINLFRENPADFWRGYDGSTPKDYWDAQKLLQALEDYNLVPVSDPNVPSHIHRLAKALGLVQLASLPMFTPMTNVKELYIRTLKVLRVDSTGLVIDPPPPSTQPNPDLMRAQAAMIKAQADVTTAQKEIEIKQLQLSMQDKIAQANITREAIIHQADQAKLAREDQREQISLAAQQRKDEFDRQHSLREHDLNIRKQQLDEARANHEAQMAQGGFVTDNTSSDREHEHKMREHSLAQQEHELEKAKTAHQMELEKHQHALEVEKHRAEHEHRMRELDTREKEIEVKKIAAEKPAPKARATGGRVETDENSFERALRELSDSFKLLARAQNMPRVLVRDSNGDPIGTRPAETLN